MLVAVALAGIAGVLVRQQQVTDQEAAARTITAVAREHRDDDVTLVVELPDGTRWSTPVLYAGDYPIGDPVELLVDDEGLRQLRSEPYDISLLLIPLVLVAGAGVALTSRAVARQRTLRRFFDGPQPARPVRALDNDGFVYVLIPGPHGQAEQLGVEHFGSTGGDPGDDHGTDPRLRTRPAILYGSPRPGSWCAVELDGYVYVPRAPVDEMDLVPYDNDRGLPAWLDDDGEPAADRDDLLPRDADPATVSEFTPVSGSSRGRMLRAGASGAFLGSSIVFAIGAWVPKEAFLVAGAVGLLLGLEGGWRRYLRPRMRWNTGGVSAVTPWGTTV
ncbi:hypothetical protein [Actinoplanes derwentensis]|uniref:DUF3592 domain-containing protein n=1 Tax=Actinoplanes derwentensis TaxID=113562 RepID=A0A1H1RKC7_9ACTN|nr:hypothetical protein [Actinoplanes derwentensis]GID84449.1 hypothetical protein Ade03nite_33730 [Actinoplanes derwentensis]SDS36201.1 hypothetical protein SAMN04489716_0615 [Actinoplanes derwentensis]